MREGRAYERLGDRHIEDIYAVLRGYSPTRESDVACYEDAVVQLKAVVAARIQRLYAARQQLPTPFMVLLLAGAALLICAMYALHVRRLRTHLTIVAMVAGVIAFNLFIAMTLDYPFSGDLSVSSEPLAQDLLAELHATPDDAGGPRLTTVPV